MFWSTKNSTVYNYPSANIASPSTITITGNIASPSTITITGVGGGGSGGSGVVSISNVFTLPMSGMGGGNSVLSSSGWTTNYGAPPSNTISITGTIVIDSDVPTIKTKKHKIDIDKVYENLEIINEMFNIIVPDFDKLNKHPTLMDAFVQYDSAKHIEPRYNSEQLKAAYQQFKLLEALLTEEKNDNS